jgi:hypothetical protein
MVFFVEAVCNILASAHRFRVGAGLPTAEVGVSAGVIVNGNPLKLIPAGHGKLDAFGQLNYGIHELARYTFTDESDVSVILNELTRDLLNAAGRDFESQISVELSSAQ